MTVMAAVQTATEHTNLGVDEKPGKRVSLADKNRAEVFAQLRWQSACRSWKKHAPQGIRFGCKP